MDDRRTTVDNSGDRTTVVINWTKLVSALGVLTVLGGLVTTSVQAAVTVAEYKAQIVAHDQKIREQEASIATLRTQVSMLQATQSLLERLQGRIAALETYTTTEPATEVTTEYAGRNTRYARTAPRSYAAGVP